ncbi:MAG: hypothetical protein CMO01_03050 [Thalassobius sp.]|nr:hypothetical protein [Thalassovita sp.]
MTNIKVSLLDRINFLFIDQTFITGLIFFVVGSIILYATNPNIDLNSFHFWMNKTTKTETKIKKVKYTDNTDIYYYDFEANGETYLGNSTASGYLYDADDKVTIEYAIDDPNISRIDAVNHSSFDFTIVIILIFPIIGLVSIGNTFKQMFSVVSILKNFSQTDAVFVDMEATSIKINDNPIYKIKYSYTVDHTRYQNTTKSLKPDKFDGNEVLLYSKSKPEKSVLLKKLPKSLQRKV